MDIIIAISTVDKGGGGGAVLLKSCLVIVSDDNEYADFSPSFNPDT
jgi:hypothetical protein